MPIPNEFISLSEICPNIKIQADYSLSENFTGQVVSGYKAQKAFMTKFSASALQKVQMLALNSGLCLKIFDAYRPLKAVQSFQEWANKPEDNFQLKNYYYPKYDRLELFKRGFIAKESTHSFGIAVDLTLLDLSTGLELDMGSHFDYFDDISVTNSPLITKQQQENRRRLIELMESQRFKNYSQEWWHFSLKTGLASYRAFDFDIE